MSTPITHIGSCHNVFIRQMYFEKAGDSETQHHHAFDHITLLARGSIEVEVEGQKTTFKAPHMIYIRADKRHGMVALEDDSLAYCVHALVNHTDKNIDDIITPEMIPNGSYTKAL